MFAPCCTLVLASMRLSFFLLSLCAFRFIVADDFLSGNENDPGIFLDSNDELSAETFIPQDSISLSAIPEDSSTQQDLPLDYSNFLTFDQTNPVELAEANNFCGGDEEGQYLGKMRARKEQDLCKPGSNTNLLDQPKLELPNLFDIFRPKKPKKDTEPATPPVFEENEGLIQLDDVCDSMHRVHLCCLEPAPDSLYSSYGTELYSTMLGCRSFFFAGQCAQVEWDVCCSGVLPRRSPADLDRGVACYVIKPGGTDYA